ncbi:MAG: hypothetical protein V9E87_06790 [Gemmatimonadales bacterium]
MRRAWVVAGAVLLGIAPLRARAQQAAPLPSGTVALSLAQALARVDSASEAVGIARAAVRTAEAGQMKARSAYLPQLNGSVAYTRTLKTQFSGLSSGSNDSTPAPTNCGTFRPNPSLPSR